MSGLAQQRVQRLLDYLLAAALAAAALLLRMLLPIAPGVGLYPLPLSAIIISAWRGGRGPGLLATLVSAAGIVYWFSPTLLSGGIGRNSGIGFAIFVAVAVLAIEFSMARQRAERALRESETRLRQVAETSPGVLWVATLEDRRVLYVNPSYQRIWGRPAETILGTPLAWPQAVLADDEPRVTSAFGGWMPGPLAERLELEYRIQRPDGSVRWIHDRAVFVPAGTLRPARITGIADDVTERSHAEEALRRSQAYLAETQRLSHTGSWAFVPSTGEIRYLSDEGRRILDLTADAEPARFEPAFLQRIHREDRAATIARVRQAVERREDFELEYRIIRRGGDTRDIYAIGHPVFTPSAELTEFVGTILDVTERNQADRERERLRQAQADLERINRVSTMGELAASLAHEIRQPIAAALTNARTCLRWLEREEPDLLEARAAASRAADDTTRAAEIITRVRSLFQKAAPRRDVTDVNAVVTEMVSVLRGEAQRHAVAIRTDLSGDLPPVIADRVQLQQVLLNLILNGIDATKTVAQPRELHIRTRPVGIDCEVSVVDTGPGLPQQQPDRIFDAFFTTKPDGTGMGLPISRSIIESHGGRLWAEGGAVGGAAFHFTLPAATEAGP